MPALPLQRPVDLARDEIHVVCIRLDEPVAGDETILGDDERARAGRFLHERERRRFVAAHAATRTILSAFAGQPAAALEFERGERGKPRLAGSPRGIEFNLTHSGERAMVAVAKGRAVGVDVEQERDVDVLKLARRFFSPWETAALESLQLPDQTASFFRCWTRKEAFIKAIGDGLSFPLQDFDVTFHSAPCSQALRACRNPGARDRWRIVPLDVEAGYAAALASEDGNWRVVQWSGLA